jgi:hypothetical protein
MPILGIIASQNRPRGFDPLSIANCKYWYDASDTSTITSSSGRVSAITNKTGTALTLSQGTSGQQPLIVTNVYNGLQILRLTTARGDVLKIASTNISGSVHSTFLVTKTNSTANGYRFSFGQNTAFRFPLLYQLSNNNYYETGSGSSAISSSVNTQGTLNIFQLIHNGTAVTMKSYFGATTNTVTATGGSSLNIGTQTTEIGRAAGENADFDFCEVLTYQAGLTSGEVTSVVDYLKTKWGV